MQIHTQLCFANPEKHKVLLATTISGLSLTTEAGSFRVNGVDLEFAEEQVFTVTPSPYRQEIQGFLVLDKRLNQPVLLVDEWVADGADQPYSFAKNGPYKLLARLYTLKVPAAATDLSNATLTLFHIVEQTPPLQ